MMQHARHCTVSPAPPCEHHLLHAWPTVEHLCCPPDVCTCMCVYDGTCAAAVVISCACSPPQCVVLQEDAVREARAELDGLQEESQRRKASIAEAQLRQQRVRAQQDDHICSTHACVSGSLP